MSDLRLVGPEEFLALSRTADWEFADLERLHAAIQAKCRLQEELPGLACRKGCHHCCRRIPSLLPVEFAYLAHGFPERNLPSLLRLRDCASGRLPSGADLPSGDVLGPRDEVVLAGEGLRSELHPGELLCGLLDGRGACRHYERRPVVCRTHGLLILSEAGLDHCPWNFQDLEEIDESLPFSLESLHETSLRVNLAFLRKSYPDAWRDLAGVRVVFQS